MKNLILFVALATLTSCSSTKYFADWKDEIKSDMSSKFGEVHSISDVAISTDQPKSKVENDWYEDRMDNWRKYGYSGYYIPYYYSTYIPSYSYNVRYTSWGGKYYTPYIRGNNYYWNR